MEDRWEQVFLAGEQNFVGVFVRVHGEEVSV
jgi:hypothetical protein